MFGAVILWGVNPVAGAASGRHRGAGPRGADGVLRLPPAGAYFAIGTWVIAEVVRLMVAQWQAVGGGTGTSLPRDARAGLWGLDMVASTFDVRGSAATDILAYWLALILAVATIGGIYGLLRSKRGLALAAVRDNVQAAQSVGVDTARLSWIVFLVAAFGTGIAGALIFLQNGAHLARRGLQRRRLDRLRHLHRGDRRHRHDRGADRRRARLLLPAEPLADYGSWYLMVLGALGIVIMLFAPRGLWGLVSERTGLQLFPIRRRLEATSGHDLSAATTPEEEAKT